MFKVCESLTRFTIQLLKEPASCLKYIQTKLRQNVRTFAGLNIQNIYICMKHIANLPQLLSARLAWTIITYLQRNNLSAFLPSSPSPVCLVCTCPNTTKAPARSACFAIVLSSALSIQVTGNPEQIRTVSRK